MNTNDLVAVGYRDLELVGSGGLGTVYRAVRISTGGHVAIKELRHVEAASPAWHRARRELDAMLRLKGHPYVVSVEEIVDGPSGPCIVMEYIPGGSLGERIALGPIATGELVLIGQQTSAALAAAHEAGIVHRDVKPHNILVGAYGQVKVCDFGIASLAKGPDGRTQTQALTLAYASPEELDGEPVGPPADVYSFGATLMHLITGRKPTLQERMSAIVDDPAALDDPIRRQIGDVVRRCLVGDPNSRPRMSDLTVEFERLADALGPNRASRLGPAGAAPGVADATVVRRPAPPSPPPPPPPPPVSMAAPTSDRTVMSAAPFVPTTPAAPTMPGPAVPAPAPPRRNSAPWWFATIVAVAVVVAGAVLFSQRGNGASGEDASSGISAPDTTPLASVAPDTTAAPASTLTVTTVPETAAPATAAPATAAPATAAPITAAPITAAPITAAPATAPPATPAPVIVRCVRSDIDFSALRSEPNRASTLLAEIPPGTCDVVVTATVGDGQWLAVTWNGIAGYSAASNFA